MRTLSNVVFEDSWLYKEIFARGGRKALIDGLASYGSVNWGASSEEILGELDKIASSDILKKLYPRLGEAKSWEDLLRFSHEA